MSGEKEALRDEHNKSQQELTAQQERVRAQRERLHKANAEREQLQQQLQTKNDLVGDGKSACG